MLIRRTKIVATLGPASNDSKTLQKLIEAGANVVRLNMSHGQHRQHAQTIKRVRQIAKKIGKEVGVLIDLQGPKIRIAGFKQDKVVLEGGQEFILDANLESNQGDEKQVGIDYKQLPLDVEKGNNVLLDDGRLVLEVLKTTEHTIHCKVLLGGELSNHKGINRQGGGLSAKALTEKDMQDIAFAVKHDADYIALSFVRSAQDIIEARHILDDDRIRLIAKIERVEAVENLTDIIEVSDAVMVARGDLGVEIGFAELPAIQKKIIRKARNLNKAVITATQMMESMIYNPIPTRAEVSDVANAVVEGTDAVMLSAETATGKYPVKVIECVSQVCLAAERQRVTKSSHQRFDTEFSRDDEAIAYAAMYTANHLGVQGIIALTESGSTPLWMSRIRSGIPIYGISRNPRALAHMTLYRGVYPIEFDVTKLERWQVIREIITALRDRGIVQAYERVIVTRGDVTGVSGRSNSMKIVTVEPATD